MKKTILMTCAAVALLLFSACQKTVVNDKAGDGYLSLAELSLEVDEAIETKATAASGHYAIIIFDAEENECVNTTYSAVQNDGGTITLPAGSYTFIARSVADEVPVAAFEQPVYGTTTTFSIKAGEVTSLGSLTCTLVQCKVTVAYSDEFLADVTGAGSTKVSVTSGYPLEYALNADKTYDQSAGYFTVEAGCTMEVVFSGSIEGKTQKMTKVFTNIKAKQWHQVKFIKKTNEQGNATFDIVIQDLIGDATLNNVINPDEVVIGEDPDAPKGDGGIMLQLDYEAGCDEEITDLENIEIVPVETRDMGIHFKAIVPAGVKKFTVDIASTSEDFLAAVAAADAIHLDLVNPTAQNGIIFDVVPFPHGTELLGKTEISFDLSAAQDAIVLYAGTHTFTMNITDQDGCKNTIPVAMIVK